MIWWSCALFPQIISVTKELSFCVFVAWFLVASMGGVGRLTKLLPVCYKFLGHCGGAHFFDIVLNKLFIS